MLQVVVQRVVILYISFDESILTWYWPADDLIKIINFSRLPMWNTLLLIEQLKFPTGISKTVTVVAPWI